MGPLGLCSIDDIPGVCTRSQVALSAEGNADQNSSVKRLSRADHVLIYGILRKLSPGILGQGPVKREGVTGATAVREDAAQAHERREPGRRVSGERVRRRAYGPAAARQGGIGGRLHRSAEEHHGAWPSAGGSPTPQGPLHSERRPIGYGTPPPDTSHRVTKRAPRIRRSGSSPSRRASRGWSHVGARLPCSDTWSVSPVYASFAQLTSPHSQNKRPKGRSTDESAEVARVPRGAPDVVCVIFRTISPSWWRGRNRTRNVIDSVAATIRRRGTERSLDLLYAPTLGRVLSGRSAGADGMVPSGTASSPERDHRSQVRKNATRRTTLWLDGSLDDRTAYVVSV
jgi:hypothetical protein